MNINSNFKKDILALLSLKLILVGLIYYFMHVVLGEDLFNYYDLAYYMQCIPSPEYTNTNLLYRKFICLLGLNYMGSMSSITAITIAIFFNSIILIGFYSLFSSFLNRKGQLIFIFFLAFHPYLAIYFPRLYTDVFASIGILLISFYVINEKKIDFLFIIIGLLLINMRGALIPAFFVFGIFNLFLYFQENKSLCLKSILLLFCIFLNFFLYKDFAESFLSFSFFSEDGLLQSVPKESPYFSSQYPYLNPILLLGFRESVSNIGFSQLFVAGNLIGYGYLFISLSLVTFHLIGIIGLIKFSIMNNKFMLLSTMAIIIVPLIATVSHLRYLLPLMPLLVFGFAWIISQNLYSNRMERN